MLGGGVRFTSPVIYRGSCEPACVPQADSTPAVYYSQARLIPSAAFLHGAVRLNILLGGQLPVLLVPFTALM